jgi:alpha-beta hydrolase superfamily lysophospholipase
MHEPAYACLYGFAAVCMRADSPGHDQAPRQPMQIEVDVERFRVLEQGEDSQLCHGVADTADTWRSQTRAVSQAGHRVVALGVRGYGET